MSQHHNRPLNKQDYKTLSLAALGGALEFYDFIIFIFFAVALGELFFPADIPEWLRQLQTFGIFAAGYLVRPLGGIVMAHFGDLIGRKKMFSLSILLMAVPTLTIGLLPTYDAIGIAAPILLLLMRIMQGAAIGGEVPGAWVFVAEHVPHKRIGFACGVLTAGLSLGILFGSLVATIITSIYSRQEVLDWAWRLPFFLGGIFGLCAMYLRRWLHETPVFKEMQERKALAGELPLKTVVFNHKRAISISMLLTWLLSAGIVVVILMTPTYMQSVFNLEQSLTLKANSLAIISLAIGCISVGYLCDKWGAGIVLIIGCTLLAATTWFFYHNISHEPLKLFSTYSLAGLTVGVIGATPFVMVKSYPPEVRFSGISFAYNLAYAIFGGLTPIFVTLLLTYTALAPAYYMMTLSAVGLLLGFYLRKKSI
ncbi:MULTISPECIES: MFS transporter [Xenorhabdus]|uniref:Alpha-ketoglutarate permease n=1 Tax=Xenorhabdus ehlersii TaxID=290111 RepID=A0A2D0IPA4_9GAMM|nr:MULTISPECIES: MFS transporter [Xenorhabdus]MBC8950634.1 alpha-ketoglutarate permease [Xenorhabdus sp. TS4]PHM23655.1 alpha-ketoglutarate permease [Xenorhabdus ehlersii]RKE92741.1 putative MFS family arabinose efflux permease [Xenorhabdus ehlersii]